MIQAAALKDLELEVLRIGRRCARRRGEADLSALPIRREDAPRFLSICNVLEFEETYREEAGEHGKLECEDLPENPALKNEDFAIRFLGAMKTCGLAKALA